MTSGSNSFNDFPEIVPTREITTNTEKIFHFLVRGRGPIFLEWAYCCSISSTHLNPALELTLILGDQPMWSHSVYSL